MARQGTVSSCCINAYLVFSRDIKPNTENRDPLASVRCRVTCEGLGFIAPRHQEEAKVPDSRYSLAFPRRMGPSLACPDLRQSERHRIDLWLTLSDFPSRAVGGRTEQTVLLRRLLVGLSSGDCARNWTVVDEGKPYQGFLVFFATSVCLEMRDGLAKDLIGNLYLPSY